MHVLTIAALSSGAWLEQSKSIVLTLKKDYDPSMLKQLTHVILIFLVFSLFSNIKIRTNFQINIYITIITCVDKYKIIDFDYNILIKHK